MSGAQIEAIAGVAGLLRTLLANANAPEGENRLNAEMTPEEIAEDISASAYMLDRLTGKA